MGPVSQEEINLPLFRMFRRSWFMHDREVPGAGLSIVCLLENVCENVRVIQKMDIGMGDL